MPRLRLLLFTLAIACLAKPRPLVAFCPYDQVVKYLTGGTAPTGVVVGDFNGDGKLDIAAAFRDSNNVVVYFGNGTGGFNGFNSQTSYAVGALPIAIATGDVNRDGKLDLVTVSASALTGISVLKNNGNGTFANALGYGAGAGSRAIATGDLNNDGTFDLAIPDYDSNNLRFHAGDGNGNYNSYGDYAVGMHPTDVAVADFNGDGKLDIAVTDEGSDNVAIILSYVGGWLPAVFYSVGHLPAGIAAADFNHDGKIDLAVTTSVDSSILLNGGSGVFTPGMSTIYAGVHIVAADLDGDGNVDMAIINNPYLTFVELNADGSYKFAIVNYVGTTPGGLAVGDFDGDGRPDLVYAETANNRLAVLQNSGRCFANCGSFVSAGGFSTGVSPSGVAVGDLNRDGRLDLAVPNSSDGTVSILRGNASGFDAPDNRSTGPGATAAAIADVNGDGRLDIVVANPAATSVSTLLGAANGGYSLSGQRVQFAPYSIAVADFNRDTRPDFAIADPNDNAVSVWTRTANGTYVITPQSVGTTPFFATVGDFNGDGKPDIVSANSGSDDVSVLLGNGDGTFASAVSYAAGVQPQYIVGGDFNHDGKSDLAVANKGAGTVSILFGTGTGTFAAPIDYLVDGAPVFIAVGDFNLDGNDDLAVANFDTNSVTVLAGSSTGTFTTLTAFGTGAGPSGIAVGDFNGDGKPDIVTVNGGSDYVELFLNQCLFPELTVKKSHAAPNFWQGETGAQYTIRVDNIGTIATNATAVTASDTLPQSLIATAMSGTGWTCSLASVACTRSDALAAGSSYPPITLTVNVRSDAPTFLVNIALIAGGGDTDVHNNDSQNSVTVNPMSLIAPTSLVATAQTIAQINVTWDAVTDANGYVVFRNWSGGVDQFVALSPSYTDTAVSPNTTYVYKVSARNAQTTPGPPSNKDLATTMFFTDDPLVASIKAIHFTQLRSAVNAVRAAATLGPFNFTDAIAPGVFVKRIHVAELRGVLDEARAIIGVPPLNYTDPVLAPNATTIKAAHILELRAGIR